MKALAMIEVYGYLTAVEALDSALKAANVNLFQVICTRGGLVTVLITGEVGAVRAAADAAAVAAQQVGSVLSVHVIPRPADEIGRMLAGASEGESFPPDPAPRNSNPNKPEDSKPETKEPGYSETESEERKSPEPNPPRTESESMESETPQPVDWQTLSGEELHQLTVSDLRAIARSLEGCSMTRREIRFGKKEELIAEIKRFCGQEG